LAVFAYTPAFANTTYETSAPISEQTVDFPNSGSGASMTPNYGFYYRLPTGVSYDRIQMSVPESVTNITGTFFITGNINDGFEPWNCINSNCVNGQIGDYSEFSSTVSNPTAGTIQFLFSTTTNSTLKQDFAFYFDPNPPYNDVFYNGTSDQPQAVAVNGNNYAKSVMVPTIKFCNGACDNDTFSPIPNLTASPWARFTFPVNNAFIPYTANFQIQTNTGTTTPTHARVDFTSNYQDLIPQTFDIVASGLATFNFTQIFPALDDDITATVSLWEGTTTVLYESDPITLHIRETGTGTGNVTDIDICDQYNVLLGGICSIFSFLFLPDDDVFDDFSGLWDVIKNKPPFGYIQAIIDEITSIDTDATPAFSFGSIPFMDVIFTPLRSLMVWALWLIYAVYFYHRVTRMKI
jgi:hypothetical protein